MTQTVPVRTGPLLFLLGLAIFSVGVWGLWRDVGMIAQPFYVYAWWGYIFMLDGAIAAFRGDSLLTTRRKHFFPLFVGSISFWFLFELLNLRYQNWYYVGVSENLASGLVFGLFAFATVLLGMFETYEALTASKILTGWKKAPRRLPAWVSYALQGLGALMVSLSILFPTYLAPLVWGSFTFLFDPWNYRRGARSLLRDIEEGDYGLVARVLLAGAVCGLVWESMNFFVPQKWIYTVRGLENLKLFEMPLLGFLGFPALALDGVAFYAFVSYWLLGNETWERSEDLRYALAPRPRRSRIFLVATIPLQFLFWGAVVLGVREVNIGSVQLEVSGLNTLSEEGKRVLQNDLGISRPIRLLRTVADSSERVRIRAALGCSEEEFQRVLDEAELYSFKGIGVHHGVLLQAIGVHRVEQLAERDPEDVFSAIQRIADPDIRPGPPRLDMVRVWVLAARSRSLLLRAG